MEPPPDSSCCCCDVALKRLKEPWLCHGTRSTPTSVFVQLLLLSSAQRAQWRLRELLQLLDSHGSTFACCCFSSSSSLVLSLLRWFRTSTATSHSAARAEAPAAAFVVCSLSMLLLSGNTCSCDCCGCCSVEIPFSRALQLHDASVVEVQICCCCCNSPSTLLYRCCALGIATAVATVALINSCCSRSCSCFRLASLISDTVATTAAASIFAAAVSAARGVSAAAGASAAGGVSVATFAAAGGAVSAAAGAVDLEIE